MKCIECNKEKREKQFPKHTRKDLKKKYGRSNKCITCTKQAKRNHEKNRREEDPFYRLRQNLRGRAYFAFRNNGYTKDSSTYNLIGCEYEYLKKHIESQFTEGMSWDNYGEWHIDHIYPISKARDVAHLKQLCHYTNLQPLWAKENIKKSNKIPKDFGRQYYISKGIK